MKRPEGRRPSPGAHTPAARPAVRGPVHLVVSVMLALLAVLLVSRFLTSSSPPPAAADLGTIPAAGPAPAQQAAIAPAAPTAKATATSKATPKKPVQPATAPQPFHLSTSAPVSIRVPAVGIPTSSDLLTVGLNTDHTIQVPTTAAQAAWYRLGPTPGALGPAVILGHVDSNQGPGVFYNLGALRPGQIIDVTRADKSVAHFRIDAVNSYLKDQFPTQAVYGPINYAGLRLITCGGKYNNTIHHYESNTVVFASLIRT